MAFLLLLHQKMKLQRKENMLTLKQLRFSSQVDRMEKKVQKRQKYYDKLRKQIERQANCYKNSMNMQISSMFGLGTNGVNLANPYGSSMAAVQVASQYGMKNPYTGEVFQFTPSGASTKQNVFASDAEANKMLMAYMTGGIQKATEDISGTTIKKDSYYIVQDNTPVSAQQWQAVTQLSQMANAQVTQMQTQASQMKSCYENNVSIWQEAALEELEAREEWEMDLLAEEQADMEADKNSVEVQLQRVQEEKKNIEQALGQAIQDSAPKFGLA